MASFSEESVAESAADELHRIVVHWDAEADGYWLSIKGDLLEMIGKPAPREINAVRGAIFTEVGCGSRI